MLDDLRIDNEAAFEEVFKKHFRELHAYAFSLLGDWVVAEEIVQEMFLKLWEKGDVLQIRTSVKSYLYKSVYHSSLNYIRNQKVEQKYQTATAYSRTDHVNVTAQKLVMNELERHLQKALGKLPEKCRAIFHLSRFEELKYQEIANQLNISVKTVETHMGKALKILRKEMKEFLPFIAILLYNLLRS